ncbi:MAG: hypothetical protein H6704_22805 [Myxococcales bacterium]|nr:hypothetical protein [Myxococcales bacterium]
MRAARLAALLPLLLAACDDGGGADPASSADAGPLADAQPADAAPDAEPDAFVLPDAAPGATRLIYAADFDPDDTDTFYDRPYPSDARLDAEGRPRVGALPRPGALPIIEGLLQAAGQRRGWPTTPVVWFRFDGPLAPRDPEAVVTPDADAAILLLDVDPASPERGRAVPVVAQTLAPDGYIPEHLLAVAPRPGFVLRAATTYAVVVRTSAGDAEGAPLAPALLDDPLYDALWPVLAERGLPRGEVAAATVFTTGDVVADLHALTEALRGRYTPALNGLRLDGDDGADHARFCELHGTITLPTFQPGTPPYNSEGRFVFDADGLPIEQGETIIPVVVTLPKAPMPADGYPLVLYFHGSGGLSTQLVDRGPAPPGGPPAKGLGPAHVMAAHGFAMAGSAHPVNPERLPGASGIAYLNFNNLAAFPDTFRQGVIEQRLYLDALLALRLDPAVVAACDGPTLPAGADAFFFRAAPVVAMGQSMGGMYANLIGAVEPRIEAVVPTGAGGFWSHFILTTSLIPNVATAVRVLVRTDQPLTFLHPAMHLLQTAWEPAEPMVYMPRLARDPLPGHPARPTYQPIGRGDSYFPPTLYDAITLAYGHQQAGDVVWPSLQDALALAGLDGLLDYPVRDNRTARDGTPYTGVVVQYAGDGFSDPHTIYVQLDDVKYQYGCFFESFLRDGAATVPAPAPLGTPCP